MFCSATPALMNWLGQAVDEVGSTTPNPRSPVISTMSRVVRGGRRAGRRRTRSSSPRLQLGQRRGELLRRRRPVVPEHLVLHEGDALALDRVRDHARAACPARRQRRPQRRGSASWSWPSTSTHLPAERAPLVGERLQRQGLVGRSPRRLELVVVDDGDQVDRARGGRRTWPPPRSLPSSHSPSLSRTKVRHAAPRLAARQAMPGADRQAVPERAGRELDAGDARVADVPGEERAVLVVLAQPLDREEARTRPGRRRPPRRACPLLMIKRSRSGPARAVPGPPAARRA